VADYSLPPSSSHTEHEDMMSGGIRMVRSDDDEELGWTVLEPRPRSPGGVERGLFEVLDAEW
jgi:hypothetical protein